MADYNDDEILGKSHRENIEATQHQEVVVTHKLEELREGLPESKCRNHCICSEASKRNGTDKATQEDDPRYKEKRTRLHSSSYP
jgi:hypothetical protein